MDEWTDEWMDGWNGWLTAEWMDVWGRKRRTNLILEASISKASKFFSRNLKKLAKLAKKLEKVSIEFVFYFLS